jgi:hypothetical protein
MLPLSPKSCLISFPVNCLFTEKWWLSVGTTVVDGRWSMVGVDLSRSSPTRIYKINPDFKNDGIRNLLALAFENQLIQS